MADGTSIGADTVSVLPAETGVGRVTLRVADLDRAQSFYSEMLGLTPQGEGEGVVLAPRGGQPIVALQARPNTRTRPHGAVGLYHFALLFPNRRELGKVLLHMFQARWAFQGFADHAVSEAAYLSDPDGNGIELYADRPMADWPRDGDRIMMTTYALNVNSLIRAVDGEEWIGAHAGTRVGHVHLHVSDLARSEQFYREVIGFDVTNRSFPGAVFLSAGGYHHHLGINTWLRDDARGEDAAGLLSYELRIPSEEAREQLQKRAEAAGVNVESSNGGIALDDPDGNRVIIRS